MFVVNGNSPNATRFKRFQMVSNARVVSKTGDMAAHRWFNEQSR